MTQIIIAVGETLSYLTLSDFTIFRHTKKRQRLAHHFILTFMHAIRQRFLMKTWL